MLRTVLLLTGLLFVFNYIYTKTLWQSDIKKYDAHLIQDLWDRQDTADIFYLGESSNFSIHPDDTQRMSISHLIDIQLNDRVTTLNKGAYHAGLFYDLIKRISSPTVHTIVVTMNMRTLNQATLHAPIETSLQKQARFFKPLPPLMNRFLLTLNAYDDRSLAERDKAMWVNWTYDSLQSNEVDFPAPTIKSWCELPKFVDSSGVEDMAKRSLADHYVKAYAFHLKEDNQRLKQFDDIVNLCQERGYRIVFNLLAENVQYADSLCGPSLPWLMRSNRDYLVKRYTAQGATVVDNLETVQGIDYTDQHWTTEHYNQVGRQQIADRVAKVLLK